METETGGIDMTVDFTGVTLPFTAGDLLSSGMGLLGVVGGLVLLGLAFPIVSKIIGTIRQSVANRGKA
jgi:hypothetical protein